MTIGARIRRWREDRGWSLTDLARQLDIDITAQTLGRYERGERLPDSALLESLVRLGCDPTFLLGTMASLTDSADRSKQNQAIGRRSAIFEALEADSVSIDAHLFGRITDAISKIYKEFNIPIPADNLGQLVARAYSDIVEATSDRDERLTMIKFLTQQLRKDLRAAVAAPGSGKRLA